MARSKFAPVAPVAEGNASANVNPDCVAFAVIEEEGRIPGLGGRMWVFAREEDALRKARKHLAASPTWLRDKLKVVSVLDGQLMTTAKVIWSPPEDDHDICIRCGNDNGPRQIDGLGWYRDGITCRACEE